MNIQSLRSLVLSAVVALSVASAAPCTADEYEKLDGLLITNKATLEGACGKGSLPYIYSPSNAPMLDTLCSSTCLIDVKSIFSESGPDCTIGGDSTWGGLTNACERHNKKSSSGSAASGSTECTTAQLNDLKTRLTSNSDSTKATCGKYAKELLSSGKVDSTSTSTLCSTPCVDYIDLTRGAGPLCTIDSLFPTSIVVKYCGEHGGVTPSSPSASPSPMPSVSNSTPSSGSTTSSSKTGTETTPAPVIEGEYAGGDGDVAAGSGTSASSASPKPTPDDSRALACAGAGAFAGLVVASLAMF
ncbi:hypothetical protein Poli38472_001439 [Pythium oligandrum]|uniref:Elicitin-like protein n=1 Tax=Pythium oligandrum TaxID=41045 RepID=A0A8K1FT69_PYTOL|nr:hypothetical protein Poli38472_001439 [Pythium oligandrum]|eukprot:TMW69283.1 hypothetical protein Poli38472_001439 [Pythium oligandrum]